MWIENQAHYFQIVIVNTERLFCLLVKVLLFLLKIYNELYSHSAKMQQNRMEYEILLTVLKSLI